MGSSQGRESPLRCRAAGPPRGAAGLSHLRAPDLSDPAGALALAHPDPDTFYVLEGQLRIFLRDPKEEVRLGPGETYTVRPQRPHLVTNPGTTSTTFLVLQGIGEYDYVPLV